jgi:hypothetical protein
VLTRLMQGDAEGALSERELMHNCIFLLNAGHETTTNLIGNGLDALLTHRDQLAGWWPTPALIHTAVEELLRFESPLQLNNRRCHGAGRDQRPHAACRHLRHLASARPTATRRFRRPRAAGHGAQAQQPPRLRPGRARLLGHERGAAGRPHRHRPRCWQRYPRLQRRRPQRDRRLRFRGLRAVAGALG